MFELARLGHNEGFMFKPAFYGVAASEARSRLRSGLGESISFKAIESILKGVFAGDVISGSGVIALTSRLRSVLACLSVRG